MTSLVIPHTLSKWSEKVAQGHSKFKNKLQAPEPQWERKGRWGTGWSWREQRKEEEDVSYSTQRWQLLGLGSKLPCFGWPRTALGRQQLGTMRGWGWGGLLYRWKIYSSHGPQTPCKWDSSWKSVSEHLMGWLQIVLQDSLKLTSQEDLSRQRDIPSQPPRSTLRPEAHSPALCLQTPSNGALSCLRWHDSTGGTQQSCRCTGLGLLPLGPILRKQSLYISLPLLMVWVRHDIHVWLLSDVG